MEKSVGGRAAEGRKCSSDNQFKYLKIKITGSYEYF